MEKESYEIESSGMDLPEFIKSFCDEAKNKDLKTIAEEVWRFGNSRYIKGYKDGCTEIESIF